MAELGTDELRLDRSPNLWLAESPRALVEGETSSSAHQVNPESFHSHITTACYWHLSRIVGVQYNFSQVQTPEASPGLVSQLDQTAVVQKNILHLGRQLSAQYTS